MENCAVLYRPTPTVGGLLGRLGNNNSSRNYIVFQHKISQTSRELMCLLDVFFKYLLCLLFCFQWQIVIKKSQKSYA